MTKAYFKRRLLEALAQADQAVTPQERSIHLKASRYYCALLGLQRLPSGHSSKLPPVADDPPRR